MSTFVVNGRAVDYSGWSGRRLLDFLRQELGLTGVKEGCGEGECGACTVVIDGEPMCSCLVLTDMARGRTIRTVEGADPEVLGAFADGCDRLGGVQCGFCTPGFVVMTDWLRAERPDIGEPLSKVLEGNLCRCTGYAQLLEVIGDLTGVERV